ncbi:serpin family protein [Marinilabilia salmonicolor]|jgi:serpin B|uniref:Serpin B n=1 Tax=Marinilabilia salmonicolor TaxID=989 RepID=A0A368V4R6_9BACT|nr:serpin family protein [Marinilabilia salmonicolor]RCW35290.1 serpin B [Marinilabilia salmonicolor]
MIRSVFAVLIIASFAGCGWFDNDEEPVKKEFDLKSLEVLEATDRFGWELLETVNSEANEGENVVISSLSVAQALGMTTNGAAGETLDQMLEVMDFGDVETMNQSFKNIREVLQATDSKVEMEIANSVWYKQDLPTKNEFRETVAEYYDAAFSGVDFSNKEAAKELINNWVKDKTRGKIPTIIDEIGDQQYMFLVNAVYFLGKWQHQFDKSDTRDEDFLLSDGSVVQVPMMSQENDLQYHKSDDLQALKLPYGDGSFYMVIALPEEDTTVDQLIENMTSEKWNAVLGNMAERNLKVFMPRFEVECTYLLNTSLVNMGMELPFSPSQADFSNMIDAPACIDKVNHKTYIKVDEEGTEAAAATSVGMVVTSVGPELPVFRVDRPFFFAIAEEKSGAILFSGKIENPL